MSMTSPLPHAVPGGDTVAWEALDDRACDLAGDEFWELVDAGLAPMPDAACSYDGDRWGGDPCEDGAPWNGDAWDSTTVGPPESGVGA